MSALSSTGTSMRRGGQSAGVWRLCGNPGSRCRSPERTLMVVDHNVPTVGSRQAEPGSRKREQIADFAENAKMIRPRILQRIRPAAGHLPCRRTGTRFHASGHGARSGDSHTTTHGWFGDLSIGTSEALHEATKAAIQRKSRTCAQ